MCAVLVQGGIFLQPLVLIIRLMKLHCSGVTSSNETLIEAALADCQNIMTWPDLTWPNLGLGNWNQLQILRWQAARAHAHA